MREIKGFESQTIAAQQNKKERDYWLRKLAGEFQKSRLPYDRKTIAPGETKQEVIKFTFPGEVSSQLVKISRGSDANLYTIIAAGAVLLLAKYTGSKDVTVGMPVLKQDIEANFINTLLVLRNPVAGEMTFKEFLYQVRQTIAEAVENQNYPVETLVYKLGLEFDETDFPLFDAAVLLRNIQDKSYLHPVKPNVIFSFQRREQAIEGELEYNALLYERGTLERAAAHLSNLLQAVIFNSANQIADIEILSSEEKKCLLVDFNNNDADFPTGKTVYHFIETHAAANPGSTAIAIDDKTSTYGELNQRVNRLARLLKDNGIQRGHLVGILLNRSPLMAACILAAWKVGSAYIPMDTHSPPQRTIEMLQDSGAPAMFTQVEHLHPELEKAFRGRIMKVENLGHELSDKSPTNLDLEPDMNGLSYIIYTSGSMGRPKGAMVEHIGMMNHIQAKINDLQLAGDSVIAQNASHCFDISVWQFFTALVLGGKTVIYPDESVMEPAQFLARLIHDRVTVLEVVPSYLAVLLSILDLEFKELDNLNCLVVTGETVKPALVRRWFEKYPGIKVVNAYGPTEASDDITHHILAGPAARDQVPIGRPVQNLNIYIVDENMKLCPPGVKGEILVSGVGVGRGYLNDPEKTSQVFMADSFMEGSGLRLYKTGDLGCWLPDGTIAFFGRKDYQVKIRGYRIELEEIEIKLIDYPGMKEAVVIEKEPALEDHAGVEQGKYLCAFVTAREKLDIPVVKAYLEEILPGYMIPEYIEQIDQMPLTPNGKIDRKALAMFDISLPTGELAAVGNEIERKLVDIWSDVLGIDKETIGIDANFFHLGGHSLRATLLAAKVRKEFSTNIQLKDIFERPTIRTFSKFVQRAAKDTFVSIEPVEKKEYYPMSSAQKRMFFIQQMDREGIAYNLSAAFIVEGKLEKERFEAAFKELVARHESLRTSCLLIDEKPVQRVHDKADFEIEYYDNPPQPVSDIIRLFVRRPFNLCHAPLLRVGIIQTGAENDILMFSTHHIITDYTSHSILVREFFSLYAGEQLPFITVHYKDYAEFQNSEQEKEKIKKQEEYWLKEFEGEIPRLHFPLDFPRPEIFTYEGSVLYFDLDTELTLKIKAFMLQTNTTLFMLLLAVFNILLSKYTGQEDIIVGSTISGRSHADLHHMIGMFINMLALRNHPRSDKTFITFLKEVKEKLVNAYNNDSYQFDELVKRLGLQGDLSRNPLFDAALQVLNAEDEQTGYGDLTFKPYEFKTDQTLFDLFLEALEADNSIHMSLRYSTVLFKKSTVERITEHFMEILKQVLTDMDMRLEDITISHHLAPGRSAITREESMGFEF